jgi:hypothetical protein
MTAADTQVPSAGKRIIVLGKSQLEVEVETEKKFKLTAKCRKCGYVITKEVKADLEDLPAAKSQFAKEVSSIHKQHPEPENFGILDKMQ